jgi:competence protein ComEA
MNDEGSGNPLDSLIAKYKIPLGLSLVGGVLMIGGLLSSGLLQKTFVQQSPSQTSSLGQSVIGKRIKVDISGAVLTPGVYELPSDARVEQVIEAAGGLTMDADPKYISKSLNLAQRVSDGLKIYIPPVGESGGVAGASTESEGVISLNDSSLSTLEKLPGVGPATAQKIIDGRPYSSIEDLLIKKVIGRGVYEKIKDKVSI